MYEGTYLRMYSWYFTPAYTKSLRLVCLALALLSFVQTF